MRLSHYRLPTTLCLLWAALLASPLTLADTVSVPVGQQSDRHNIERPKTGMSKAQVRKTYGDPNSTVGAVGTPPISRWIYKDFTVYFEYNHVVHSVLDYR